MMNFITSIYQKHRLNVPPFNQVLPNVYIGSYESVPIFCSRRPGPSLVINCTPDIPPPLYCGEFIRIPVLDNLQEIECKKMHYYLHIYNVLEKMHARIVAGEPVLIHCMAGMQRSCAVVACYLCRYHNMTIQEAVNYIRSQRPVAFHRGVNFANTIFQYNKTATVKPV
jgi:hypothetical protein